MEICGFSVKTSTVNRSVDKEGDGQDPTVPQAYEYCWTATVVGSIVVDSINQNKCVSGRRYSGYHLKRRHGRQPPDAGDI